jgi:hypothetical protein
MNDIKFRLVGTLNTFGLGSLRLVLDPVNKIRIAVYKTI